MLQRFFKSKPYADNTDQLNDPDNTVHLSEASPEDDTITAHEKTLLNNILKLRDLSVHQMMVPRADIIAADINTPCRDLIKMISEHQISRIPIYEDNLDTVIGSLHIKDLLRNFADADDKIDVRKHLIDIPIVSPAMPVLDLIIEMRQTRRHMVLVVDEYGGIDGLITLGDIIETIVGEIHDEHDNTKDDPQMKMSDDGVLNADGRIDIETFETAYGNILQDDERDEIDTLGGLVYTIAGRIPDRGEILTHRTGMTFEIVEADPRRIHKMRIRNIPAKSI